MARPFQNLLNITNLTATERTLVRPFDLKRFLSNPQQKVPVINMDTHTQKDLATSYSSQILFDNI